MVHFEDQDKQEENLNLVDRILQITNVNDRVSYMDKLEGLNKEFQTKVINYMSERVVKKTVEHMLKGLNYLVHDPQHKWRTDGCCSF